MRFTLIVAIYLLGIATAACTTVPQYRYGQWLDPAAFFAIGDVAVPYGTAALMVSLHWAKILFAAAIVPLWRSNLRGPALVVGIICIGLATLSLWSSLALLELNRTKRMTTSDAVLQRDADLRAEMKAIAKRLALVGWRPFATVTAEIIAERRHYGWGSTSECTKITTSGDRRYCARLDKLEGERAVALEAEQLRKRQAEVRRSLEQQPMVMKGRQPDLALLADALGASPERAELLRAFVYSVLVETVELALFWVAGLLPWGSTSAGRRELATAASISGATNDASDQNEFEGDKQPGAGADVLPATPERPPARKAAVSRSANKKSSTLPSSIVLEPEACKACPRAQLPSTRAPARQDDERRRAVAAFVAQLPRSGSARSSGSALYAAYDHLRGRDGWPVIPPNVFGTLLKPVVEAAGGQKRKSNQQIYVGVGLPPAYNGD
jgi:hypothetical protein